MSLNFQQKKKELEKLDEIAEVEELEDSVTTGRTAGVDDSTLDGSEDEPGYEEVEVDDRTLGGGELTKEASI